MALSHLARFTEAHRHLGSAFARLSRSKAERREERWGILELRRGAISLRQAQWLCMSRFGSTDETNMRNLRLPTEEADASVRRHAIAMLDDAWSAVRRARECFAGNSRIGRWWGEVYVIELRILAMYVDLDCVDGIENQRVIGLPDHTPDRRLERTADLVVADALLPKDSQRRAEVLHLAAVILAGEYRRPKPKRQPNVRYLFTQLESGALELNSSDDYQKSVKSVICGVVDAVRPSIPQVDQA
jgi:hypothetical protein